MKIENWEYIDNSKGNDISFEIIPPNEKLKQTPKSLFKFYPLNSNSIDAFVNSYFYASDKWSLNDPFDCSFKFIDFYEDINVEFIEELKEEFKDLYAYNRRNCKLTEIQNIKILIQRFQTMLFEFFGVISFTDLPNCDDDLSNARQILMWSHYSQNSGFCLEFDVSKIPKNFQNFSFQINYIKNISKVVPNKNHEPFLYQTNVKSDIWEYESEWRLIVSKKESMSIPGLTRDMKYPEERANRNFHYENAIQSITFGMSFFDNIFNFIEEEATVQFTAILSEKQREVVDFAIRKNFNKYIILNPDILFSNFGLHKRAISIIYINFNYYRLIISK